MKGKISVILLIMILIFNCSYITSGNNNSNITPGNVRGNEEEIIKNQYFNNNDLAFIDLSWKPDGSYALIVGENGSAFIYDGITLIDISNKTGTNDNFISIAWHPTGNLALIIGYNSYTKIYRLYKYNETAGFTPIDLPNSSWRLSDLDWKPDGSYALIVGRVGEYGLILKYDPNGIWVLNHSFYPLLIAVSWNPNGSEALIVGRKCYILKYNGMDLKLIYRKSDWAEYYDIAWKPDGSCALIVGEIQSRGSRVVWSEVLLYYLQNITCISCQEDSNFSDHGGICVSWKPDGSCSYYISIFGLLRKYDGINSTIVNDSQLRFPYSMKCNPKKPFAVIISHSHILENSSVITYNHLMKISYNLNYSNIPKYNFELQAPFFPEFLDGDILPDQWEIKYFGNISQEPYNDYDSDGLTNYDEYINYTDPTIPNIPNDHNDSNELNDNSDQVFKSDYFQLIIYLVIIIIIIFLILIASIYRKNRL